MYRDIIPARPTPPALIVQQAVDGTTERAVAGGGPTVVDTTVTTLPTAPSCRCRKSPLLSTNTKFVHQENLFSFFTRSLSSLCFMSRRCSDACLLALLRRATLRKLTVPTVGRFRTTGDAFLTTDRVVFCARKPHGSQNGERRSASCPSLF